MKKVISGISCLVLVLILTININIALKPKGTNVDINLSNIEVLANSYAEGDYYCCAPYDPVCVEATNAQICGTLKTTKCP